ncbi:unnamed protein product, partial [Brenthis ino]
MTNERKPGGTYCFPLEELKSLVSPVINNRSQTVLGTGADHSDKLMIHSCADDMYVDIAETRNHCNDEDAPIQLDEGVRMSGEAV